MRHCYILRVFTTGDEGGNPLGVVTDVTGLDEPTMQRIATELAFSETVFVDWLAGGTPRARIFTPAREIPFAGHPLVGAAWVLTVAGPGCARIAYEVGEVEVRRSGDEVWVARSDRPPVADASLDLGGWARPVSLSTVRLPLVYHVVEVATPEEVSALAGEPPVLDGEVYVWAWEDGGRAVRARFFAPGVGVPEDPATGSAAVALAAVLAGRGMERGDLEVRQGAEMGRPSRIRLRWGPEEVAIGGTVRKDEVRILEV